MGFDALIAASQRLNTSVETLAALGAELRLRREGDPADPRVRKLLNDVLGQLEPKLLEGVDTHQEAAALAFITSFFHQAIDLLENPGRPSGWTYEDPIVLQSQGQASRLVARGIEALGKRQPDLGETLRRPGTFLDVGTGVGLLAIEAAQSWPAMQVVGIDIWAPALALARMNVESNQVADRVELRNQDVQRLDDRERYTLAWLAGPFIPYDIVTVALERIHRALAPGGWLVFGLYAPQPNLLGEALNNLRIVRSGGHPWAVDEILTRLRALDFSQIDSFSPNPPIQFVFGRKA